MLRAGVRYRRRPAFLPSRHDAPPTDESATMDFQTQLNAIISDEHPVSVAGLTFLSDIPSEDRPTLALIWPA